MYFLDLNATFCDHWPQILTICGDKKYAKQSEVFMGKVIAWDTFFLIYYFPYNHNVITFTGL